jgi:hypothetical protein
VTAGPRGAEVHAHQTDTSVITIVLDEATGCVEAPVRATRHRGVRFEQAPTLEPSPHQRRLKFTVSLK